MSLGGMAMGLQSNHKPSSTTITSNNSNNPKPQQSQTTVTEYSSNGDPLNEIKTEFYTREGLWKLVPQHDFLRQQQLNIQQQQLSTSTGTMSNNQPNNSMNNNSLNTQGNSSYSNTNDPVKVALFKYAYNDDISYRKRSESKKRRLICSNCSKLHSNDDKIKTNSKNYDDNDDVIINKNSINCKYCNNYLIMDNDSDSNNSNDNDDENYFDTINNDDDDDEFDLNVLPNLDVLIFNYAKEIYLYEFNQSKSKVKLNLTFIFFENYQVLIIN
jgi:hypothetical protein